MGMWLNVVVVVVYVVMFLCCYDDCSAWCNVCFHIFIYIIYNKILLYNIV